MRQAHWMVAWLLCSFGPPAWAADMGVMLREDGLRDAAAVSATVGAKVPKDAKVEILGRQGAWMRIGHEGRSGWVRLLNVRKGEASKTDVAGGIASVFALGATRNDPSRVVATAGVRGLNEEELKGAKFDPQQLEVLDQVAVDQREARKFARQGQLAAREVAYLPDPKGAPRTDPGSSGHDLLGGE